MSVRSDSDAVDDHVCVGVNASWRGRIEADAHAAESFVGSGDTVQLEVDRNRKRVRHLKHGAGRRQRQRQITLRANLQRRITHGGRDHPAGEPGGIGEVIVSMPAWGD